MRWMALVAVLWTWTAGSAAPWCVVVAPEDAPALVHQAATELSAYLERMLGEDDPTPTVPIVAAAGEDQRAIILRVDPHVAGGEEGYRIGPEGAAHVVIEARTPLGVLHGAYRLLAEYGFGFYLDGDAVPSRPRAPFLRPSIAASPVFSVRGSLPWYNFLNSPTTWDDQDFRFLADQIIRSGQNFVGFHTYDFEPFAAYDFEGRVMGGEPLQTTEGRVWGTWPMKVDEFGFGSARFFPGVYWGSDVAMLPGSREDRIARQKALLARGLAYASARGVKTCLGFEVSGDPTDMAEQERFKARLTQLLRDYPMLDYVWLWQQEARSLEGTSPPPLRSQAGALYRAWEEAFASVGSPARRWEGMRMAKYGELACKLVDAVAPEVRVVLSGWGGDHHLRVSDYFPCWDRVLDRRVIFAALDDIVVSPQVSQHYALPPDRERWAIPWYEFDGDQWFPQANAHTFWHTVRDARAKGCQGLLAIHWRTKEVGESQALVARYAWQPDETLDEFYRDYAARRFGPAVSQTVARALQELDALGYRWIGGGGQAECGEFAWCHVVSPQREATLERLRRELAGVRKQLPADAPSGARGRLDDVIATIDRAVLFNRIAGLLVASGPVEQALGMPQGPERQARCAQLADQLSGPDFQHLLDLYARTITSRGELGVLATINGKAFHDYRRQLLRLREAAGRPADVSDLIEPREHTAGILSDFQLSTAPAEAALPVRCVAWDGDRLPVRVLLEYRGAADAAWRERELVHRERAVFEGEIPAEALRPGRLRYRLRAQYTDHVQTWPQERGEDFRQVTVFPTWVLVPRQNAVAAGRVVWPPDVALLAQASDPGTVHLSWPGVLGLPAVTVERRAGEQGWESVATTLDSSLTDYSAPADSRVDYRINGPTQAPLTCSVLTTPVPPPTPPAGLQAHVRGSSAGLTWAAADLSVTAYRVERAASAAGPWVAVPGAERLEPSGFSENRRLVFPGVEGPVWYRVVALGADERSAAGDPVPVQVILRSPPPVLALEFEEEQVQAPTGPVEFTGPHSLLRVDGRGVLRTDGGLTVPYGEAVAMRDAFTVAIRFCQSEITPMPVLVSQGVWQGPGYFVQLYMGRLRFYASGAGCLDAPCSIAPGQWHTAICVYDGSSLAAYLDGTLIGEQPAQGPFIPADFHFTVGRYVLVGPEWTFRGDVDFVRLYNRALDPALVMQADAAGLGVNINWASPDLRVYGQEPRWHQDFRLADGPGGPALDAHGGVTIPYCDLLGIAGPFELRTRFLLRSVEGMPVLVNQGRWPTEGYMLQVLGGRIRFHLGGIGSLDCGPQLAPDRWYEVRCVYDGTQAHCFLDGEQVGQMATPAPLMPSVRPLRIGRYEDDAPQYVVDGLIGPVSIRPLVPADGRSPANGGE